MRRHHSEDSNGAVPSGSSAISRPSRRRRRWIIGVALVMAVLVATPLAYAAFVYHRVDGNISRRALLPTQLTGALSPGANSTARANSPALPKAPTKPAAAANAQTYLILGSDRLQSDVQGRSDVILVAHVSADRKRIDIIHVPRDIYITIPGHGRQKINAAYNFGGAPLLVSTLEQILDVPIDHVAELGFDQFAQMTDAIGGVDIEVTEASPGFPVGTTHLQGQRAVDYVHERKHLSQGDISRGGRQLQVLKAIILKGLSARVLTNPVELTNYLDAASKGLTVDEGLTSDVMRSLAFELRDIRASDVHSWTAPWTGIGNVKGVGSVVYASLPQFAKLSQSLRTDDMAHYSDPVSPQRGWGNGQG